MIGEVFNIFNVSNLTNFNYNLVVPATFGKANQRVGQTFGSGGPRAFQIAGAVQFLEWCFSGARLAAGAALIDQTSHHHNACFSRSREENEEDEVLIS